jgi:hypothetical protein
VNHGRWALHSGETNLRGLTASRSDHAIRPNYSNSTPPPLITRSCMVEMGQGQSSDGRIARRSLLPWIAWFIVAVVVWTIGFALVTPGLDGLAASAAVFGVAVVATLLAEGVTRVAEGALGRRRRRSDGRNG